MNNYLRSVTSSLLVGVSLLTCYDAHASDPDQLQVQVLEPRSVQQQTLLAQEYDRLFLDDWQKLVLAGKNEEAVQLALATEKDCCTAMNYESFKRNTALSYSLYRLSQHRSYLQPDERFSPFHFRLFHSNPENLIGVYRKNIELLEKELESQESRLARLREMEQTAPNQRNKLKAEIEAYLKKTIDHRDAILETSDDQEVIAVVSEIGEQVSSIYMKFCSYDPQLYGDEEARQAFEEIESTRIKMFERLNSLGFQKKADAIMDQYLVQPDLPEETRKKLASLCYHLKDFFSPPLWVASTCKDWLLTKPGSSLSQIEAKDLADRVEHLETLRKDTQDQIAKEAARIEFIKANPEFFQIPFRSRAELLGVTNSEEWWVSKPYRPVGNGVVVGVIDSFDSRIQTSKILHKAVNPDFVGSGYVHEVNESVKEDHGIGVASIIVSDDMDSKDRGNGITVGVAPGAQFEMIDCASISIETKLQRQYGDINWGDQIEWTPRRMAEAISEMAHTGQISALGLTKHMIGDCKLLESKASIFNFSMSHSALKRFSRQHVTTFEGLYSMPVLLELMKSRLFIQALGNDGVQVCTSSQQRLIKAFALCPETAPHYLVVTNLMRDGVTLNPTSNVPGEEEYLQARTLSAPGSELTAGILTNGTSSYKDYENGGTSYATPHVTGVAAVVLSNFPTLTTAQLGNCLLNSATPLLVTSCGISYELTNATSGELRYAFANEPDAASIKINGQVIDRQDWLRGKCCFGQGRVHLENALKLAALLNEDLT